MKNIILTLALMLAASSASAQWSNDLYGNPEPAKKKQVTSNRSSQSSTYSASSSNYSSASHQKADNSELVSSYEQALIRRYNAMRNATYEQPESYWKLMEQYQSMLEKKYNQNLYNIVVIGDEMWVEPQSITAQFDGSDPASGVIQYNEEIRSGMGKKGNSSTNYASNNQPNITIQVNVVDPWDSWGYSSWIWGRPYYSSPYYWGQSYHRPYYYPSYWGGGYYPPYWGGGYYPPHWGGGYYPPYWGGGYSPNYYRNPKGTYYGNSRHNSASDRPGYNSGGSSLGGGRPSRPNGSNTIYGGVGRPTRNSGGITTNHNDNNSYTRPNNVGRPSYENGTKPSSTNRPNSTNRPSVERPKYERPNTEYERPRNTTTYERPASVSRPASTPSVSRPASSGSSSGGMGAGRPTRR